MEPNLFPGLCRSPGQGGLGLRGYGLGLWGCALPGFSGTSQAEGGEGSGTRTQDPGCARWLAGPQE